ncbi:MAG TPA: branched-chain amino acid ABC transporter permease [Methylomirabilota bacterium]|nr:branched-chain amino acid ABC transporter permease [Methylomirabilota bacterium]
MTDLIQALADGVMLGATYSLLGLGFTLIFGVLRRLNLAFGPAVLVGIYAGGLWHWARPGSLLPVLALTVAGAVLAGLYVERCSFSALARQAPVVSMISSFAVSMQLQELVTLVAPSRTMPYPAPGWLPGVELGPILFRSDGLLMWGGATVLMLAIFLVLYRTRFGIAVRAVTDSREGAALMGVNVAAVGAAAFLLASAVGGAAGILIASSQQQVTPYFGLWATVKGLTAMLLGGAGSLSGAVLGGLILGVVETETLAYWGGQWRDLAAYALLLIVSAVRGRSAGLDRG